MLDGAALGYDDGRWCTLLMPVAIVVHETRDSLAVVKLNLENKVHYR